MLDVDQRTNRNSDQLVAINIILHHLEVHTPDDFYLLVPRFSCHRLIIPTASMVRIIAAGYFLRFLFS